MVIVCGKIATVHWTTTSRAQQVAAKMIGRFFRAHGEFCASHPWEVIVALLTITAGMLTADKSTTLDAANNSLSSAATAAAGASGAAGNAVPPPIINPNQSTSAEYNAADVMLMTIVRCTAVLYCYYQFCSLHRLGSKYVLGKFQSVPEGTGSEPDYVMRGACVDCID